jgi:hypothetical protein
MNLTGKYFNLKKKASIADIFLYMIVIVLIAFVGLITLKLMNLLDDNFQANSLISAQGKSMTGDIRSRFASVVDNGFLIVLVGFAIAIIIGSSLIYSHPALYWVTIPILVFVVFMAALYSNVFYSFYNETGYTAEINQLVSIKFVLDNYPIFITGFVLVIALVLFGKSSLPQTPPRGLN